MKRLRRRHGRSRARARRASELLPDAAGPLVLTAPSSADTRLAGVDEWIASQKRKAAAELLRRELSTFKGPHAPTNEDAGPLFRGGK